MRADNLVIAFSSSTALSVMPALNLAAPIRNTAPTLRVPEELTATQRGRDISRNPRGGHHNIGFRCAR